MNRHKLWEVLLDRPLNDAVVEARALNRQDRLDSVIYDIMSKKDGYLSRERESVITRRDLFAEYYGIFMSNENSDSIRQEFFDYLDTIPTGELMSIITDYYSSSYKMRYRKIEVAYYLTDYFTFKWPDDRLYQYIGYFINVWAEQNIHETHYVNWSLKLMSVAYSKLIAMESISLEDMTSHLDEALGYSEYSNYISDTLTGIFGDRDMCDDPDEIVVWTLFGAEAVSPLKLDGVLNKYYECGAIGELLFEVFYSNVGLMGDGEREERSVRRICRSILRNCSKRAFELDGGLMPISYQFMREISYDDV